MPDYTSNQIVARGKAKFGVRVNTTDATVTTVATVPTLSNTVYLIIARVVASTTDYTTQQAGYVRTALFKNVAGTLALVGSVSATTTIETDAAWDCTMDASGTDIRVRVTGAAATAVIWHAQVDVINNKNYQAGYGTY